MSSTIRAALDLAASAVADALAHLDATEAEDTRLAAERRARWEEPILLTAKQLGKALAISARAAYDLLETGEIPPVRIGRAIRVRRDDVDEWLRARREPGAAAHPAGGQPVASGRDESMDALTHRTAAALCQAAERDVCRRIRAVDEELPLGEFCRTLNHLDGEGLVWRHRLTHHERQLMAQP